MWKQVLGAFQRGRWKQYFMACVQSGVAREVHMPLGTEPRMSFCCKQSVAVGGGEGDVRPTGLCTLFPLYFMEHRKGCYFFK